jgi:hypothetical protein
VACSVCREISDFHRNRKNNVEQTGNQRNAEKRRFWTVKVAKQWQNSFYAIERYIRKLLIMRVHRVGIEPITQ